MALFDYGSITTLRSTGGNSDIDASNEPQESQVHTTKSKLMVLLLSAVFVFVYLNNVKEWPLDEYGSSQTSASNEMTYLRESTGKTLFLLRHAKSSWVNSTLIDDFDRPLSTKGKKVAHVVGKSLQLWSVNLPDVILTSPSARTNDTLDIVLSEWVDMSNKSIHTKVRKLISYDREWYDLSENGYLDKLVDVLGRNNEPEVHSVMLVGHNPAIEALLNCLISRKSSWLHYKPGHLYELFFTTLARWALLKEHVIECNEYEDVPDAEDGVIMLHFPQETGFEKMSGKVARTID